MLHAVILHCERIGMDATEYEYMLNFQARGTQLDQMSSGNTHVNAYQRIADLFAPDQSAFPETPGQFW